MSTIIVSADEASEYVGIIPCFIKEKPTIPIKIAIPIEITTHILATLLESLSLFLFSIAINLKRI